MQESSFCARLGTPRSQGGKSTWDNIVCCWPERSPVINIRLADERYASWKQFLDTAHWSVELK